MKNLIEELSLEDVANRKLEEVIQKHAKTGFYPKKVNVFAAFEDKSLKDLKYIIIGMDPYPNTFKIDSREVPYATGKCFDVPKEVTNWSSQNGKPSAPRSLQNIAKVIFSKIRNHNNPTVESLDNSDFVRPYELIERIEALGCLFLNSYLTVGDIEKGNAKPGSHKAYWQDFTIELLKKINKGNSLATFIVYGRDAEKIVKAANIKKYKYSQHPCLYPFKDDESSLNKCHFLNNKLLLDLFK